MGSFRPHADSPEKLLQEGENIDLLFERLTPTTGRVSWQIPTPADGCSAENQAYNGMVVVLNTVANKPINRPNDGTRYAADPTADPDLHAGDKLNGALVVGAFYNDKTTTSFEITDLEDGAAYFITGHAVDAQNRYHQNGASAYSLPLQLNEPGNDTAAFHEVRLRATEDGTEGTDPTNLEVGTIYTFSLTIDNEEYEIEIDGTLAQTYDELVAEINKQIKLLDNPFQGPLAPFTGSYYYNQTTGELFLWNGSENVAQVVINSPTDPTIVAAGEYWLDPTTDTLRIREAIVPVPPTPPLLTWTIVSSILTTGYDPLNPQCDDWWVNIAGNAAYRWNGTTWCQHEPLYIQDEDPSDPETLACGSYWLNGDGELFQWNTDGECDEWVQVEAVVSDDAPTSLPAGTYWFNDTTTELNLRVGGAWEVRDSAFVQEDQPTTNIVGSEWFVPSTETLFVLNGAGVWEEVDVIVFSTDPAIVESCSLWYNSSNGLLYVYDVVNAEWDLVAQFFDQEEDPADPKNLPLGAVWVNTSGTTNQLYRWDGAEFVLIPETDVLYSAADPTTSVAIGDVWYNPELDTYFEWDGFVWNTITPIVSVNDPTIPPAGSFWFDTTTNVLNIWTGTTWSPISYSVNSLVPSMGTKWFNTIDNELYEWNGSEWIVATPIVVAELNKAEPDENICSPDDNIVFTHSLAGSHYSVFVGERNPDPTAITLYPYSNFTFEGTLFGALGGAQIERPVAGSDGLSDIPMYEQLGVGTDGTPDERRELGDSIRKQMGYPTIEIELTQKQMDEAIQSALEELRLRSASAYRRVYFMMDLQPQKQRYVLTNKAAKFNTIVSIMGMWRITAAFQSTAYAAGVYGQTMLQHLYHMGTFDLVSYHLISDYIEQLEQLFATRITFAWNESTRELDVFQMITRPERVLVDAVVERTEQELLTNRWTKNWIERWALAQCQLTLAQIRGKYATLPGAGGGVSLNAADLETQAMQNIQWCMDDIDNYVVNDVENLGIGSELIIG